jgi:hypothetical protein
MNEPKTTTGDGMMATVYEVTVLPETIDEWLELLKAEPTDDNLIDAKAEIARLISEQTTKSVWAGTSRCSYGSNRRS